jgi:hypothetical protein
MGIVCHLIQIQEWKALHLSDEAIPELFDEIGCLGTYSREELLRFEVADEPRLPIPDLRPDEPRRPIPALDLDKRWRELLLFLTGREILESESVDELPLVSQAIVGGRPIGKPLNGMDPARILWSHEVDVIAEALSMLSREDLRRRFFDPKGYPPAVLKEIVRPRSSVGYHTPDASVFDVAFPDLEHAFDDFMEDLDWLKMYYRIAEMRGNAMLIGLL